jgi:hypothetical protein
MTWEGWRDGRVRFHVRYMWYLIKLAYLPAISIWNGNATEQMYPPNYFGDIKGSVWWKLRRIKDSANGWLMVWNCGAEDDFYRQEACILYWTPFPVNAGRLIDNFWNRQSMVNSFPHCAYSFLFLMLCQCFWCCDSNSAYRQKKKSTFFLLLAQRIHSSSPISAGCSRAPITSAAGSI